jgi:hypothetical protein
VTKPVHPFKQHHARFSRAIANLPTAHDQAKEAAVEHVSTHVATAAERAGMDPDDVGVFWYQDSPKTSVRRGSHAEKLEYGTLTNAPQSTVRNAARTSTTGAVQTYHRTMWRGLGL